MTVPYTGEITAWPPGKRDNRGDFTFGSPTVFKGIYEIGSSIKLTDDKGNEFSPKSLFWTRLEVVSGDSVIPKTGWQIANGNHGQVTSPDLVGAEQIRGVTQFDNSMFGQPSDFALGTK